MNNQDSVNVGTKHSSGVSVESPRPAQDACAELWQVLRDVNVAATIGYKGNVLHVAVADLVLDAPYVPQEFMGFKTRVHQDSDHAQFAHVKVGNGDKKGCVHTRWESMQYKTKGIIPNPNCEFTQRAPKSQEVKIK